MFPWVTILFVLLAALACLRRRTVVHWISSTAGLGFMALAWFGYGATEWYLVTLTVAAAAVIAFVGLAPAEGRDPREPLPTPSRGTVARGPGGRFPVRDADPKAGSGSHTVGPPLAWRELFEAKQAPDEPHTASLRTERRPPEADGAASGLLSAHQSQTLTRLLSQSGTRIALLADTFEELMDRRSELSPRWTEHPARGRVRLVNTGPWVPERGAEVEVSFEGIAPGNASVLAVLCDWNGERGNRRSGHPASLEAVRGGPVIALVPTELPSVRRMSPRSSERARWASKCTFLPGRNLIQREPG